MQKIKVILADDHSVLRAGLKLLLKSDPAFEVVGEAVDGAQALRLVEELEAHVLILDLSMPRMGGVECIKEIKSRALHIKIVVFTMFGDEDYVKEVMQAGASAYVEKQAVDTELIAAVKAAAAGQIYLSQEHAKILLGTLLSASAQSTARDPYTLLSTREREVLKLIAVGHSLSEIGEILSLSVKTIDTYKTRVMEKLGFNKKSELVQYAFKYGLLTVKK